MRKPRTVTGRVAARLSTAIIKTFGLDGDPQTAIQKMLRFGANPPMAVAEQVSQQHLDPFDFDNDNGTDAFEAILDALWRDDPTSTFTVTVEWRRVVLATRRLLAKHITRGERRT